MTLGKKDGTGNCKKKHYIALYGKLAVVEAVDRSLRQKTMRMYERRTLSRKTVNYITDMFWLISIIGDRKDSYGMIYRIYTLI
jgi:hypothetical protein